MTAKCFKQSSSTIQQSTASDANAVVVLSNHQRTNVPYSCAQMPKHARIMLLKKIVFFHSLFKESPKVIQWKYIMERQEIKRIDCNLRAGTFKD